MAIQCPGCGRQYDVTLFEFGRSVRCDCGAMVDLKRGHVAAVEATDEPDEDAVARLVVASDEAPQAITPATWDYITSSHIADDYDHYFAYNELFRFDKRKLDEWFARPGRLLDLGCGTGRHLAHFAARGFEVTGVDLSEHMLRVARRNLAGQGSQAALVEGDITRLAELGLGRFDYIICMFSTLGMIYGRANRLRFLRTVRDHLEPDGRFAFHVHNRWHNLWYRDGRGYLRRALLKQLRGVPEAFQKDVDGYRGIRNLSVYVFSASEVRRVVADASLRVERFVCLNDRRNGELAGVARGLRANGFLALCRRAEAR
jgi:SAM-dependent methyltransferase